MDYPGSHFKAAWKAALALLCCAGLAQQAQARQAQQTQAPQAAAREQGAATQGQNRKTEGANRAAAVEDETSAAAQAARTAQSETAQFEARTRRDGNAAAVAPSYGPVLSPRGQQAQDRAQDPARKDPAEVHDETDSLSRQAPSQTQPQPQSKPPRQTTNPNLRRPAWQPAAEPMAPRPLPSADGAVTAVPVPIPIPVPATPPRPVAPSTSIIGSCQGSACTDVGGSRINGIGSGNAGVSGSGRLCTRTGTSVQCF